MLADEVLDLLLNHVTPDITKIEPADATDILLRTWATLAKDVEYRTGIALSEIPDNNRKDAIKILSNPIGSGNMQILRLRYQLICVTYPHEIKTQLEIIEQLENTEYRVDPQQKLEYAILLYQNNRTKEGGELFRHLRNLWRVSEQFVHVPDRLRWLVIEDGKTLKKVTGIIGSDYGYKAMALVQNFNNFF